MKQMQQVHNRTDGAGSVQVLMVVGKNEQVVRMTLTGLGMP